MFLQKPFLTGWPARSLAALCLLAVSNLAAETLTIGTTPIAVQTPEETCRISDEDEVERGWLEVTSRGLNRDGFSLIAAYTDCDGLARWRVGEEDFLSHYTLIAVHHQFVWERMQIPLPTVLDMLAHEYDEMVSVDVDEIVEETASGGEIRVGDVAYIGVLDRDELGIFPAFLATVVTEFGTTRRILIVNGVTVVNEKFLQVQHLRDFEGEASIEQALDIGKDWVGRLHRSN